jgi:nucleotide-binding universal stress UspA family protein
MVRRNETSSRSTAERSSAERGEVDMSGRIVVGVDGSETAALALRWAAEEAKLRDASLDVVHAWTYPYLNETANVAVLNIDFEQDAVTLLAGVVHDTLGDDPGVTVEQIVVQDGAAHALATRAEGADLVVVGSRGRGGFAGLLLGSVSQQVAHHSPCPVVIIPAAARD